MLFQVAPMVWRHIWAMTSEEIGGSRVLWGITRDATIEQKIAKSSVGCMFRASIVSANGRGVLRSFER